MLAPLCLSVPGTGPVETSAPFVQGTGHTLQGTDHPRIHDRCDVLLTELLSTMWTFGGWFSLTGEDFTVSNPPSNHVISPGAFARNPLSSDARASTFIGIKSWLPIVCVYERFFSE